MKSATRRRTNARFGALLFLAGVVGGIVAGLSNRGYGQANTSIPCLAKSRAVIANTGQSIHHANSLVQGDVQAAQAITQDAGGTINGTKIPNTPAGLSQVGIPFNAVNLGVFLLGSGQSQNLTAGNYRASSFTLNGGSTLTVSGGIVQIWVTGALVIGGQTNANGITERLEFLVNSTNDVHVNGGSNFSGLIYAPTAQVFVDAQMHGSIVGSTTILNSGGRVLFDSAATCPCPTGQTSCSGVCVNTQTDPNNCGTCLHVCTGGQTCVAGTCTCPSGQTNCSGVCKNTQTDPNNCGTCGFVCPAGTTCVTGVCTCPAGQTLCSNVCRNTQTDPNNCGTCGHVCPAGTTCQSGVCTCPAGQTLCSNVCRNTQTDSNNCGTCGNVCPAGTSCLSGICCSAGQTNCSGVCRNTQTDPNNCGACGFVCPAGNTCQSGICCSAGQTNCSGVCRSTQTDPNNCGTCGFVCPAGTTCQAGVCTCPPGQTLCSNVCRNTQTDPNNCGTCGFVCPAGTTCQAGVCTCPPGQTLCSNVCRNTQTDSNNCGACGVVCTPPNTCSGGQCVPPCNAGQTLCNGVCVNIATDPNNCGGCGIVCAASGICVASTCLPSGSCGVSNAVAALVSGANVTAYVPRGSWSEQDPAQFSGVKVVTLEGTGPTTTIPTVNAVNNCAANAASGRVVCTSNFSDVYLINGTALTATLTSSPSGTQSFSLGTCQTCGVATDPVHNRAVVSVAVGSTGGFQFLDLTNNTLGPVIPLGVMTSENVLIDPLANLVLSPSEDNHYVTVGTNAPNTLSDFFQSFVPGNGELDSAAEDCSTGIALSSVEFTNNLFLVNLAQASFGGGAWSAPSQFQRLDEFSQFANGTAGIAVDSGTHLGIVSGELAGSAFGAIQLPSAPVSGIPSVVDWAAANVPFDPNGQPWAASKEPHALTVFRSPTSKKAFGVLQNVSRTFLAVIDLQALLMAPRPSGTHNVDPTFDLVGNNVVRFVALP